ncbi:MAG: hypothetical protein PW792_11505 [Acidobacteriaceae bacterium]|nr:hypothetical protein [Acidobacteriaceae bacterium]
MSEHKEGHAVSSDRSYQTAVEVWKFQVEQYWTRSSYYVVFELALAAGIWKIFDERHWFTSGFLSLGAILFTVLWLLNNERLNDYINYYWRRLKAIEPELGIPVERQIFACIHNLDGLKRRGRRLSYRFYGQLLPPIFLFAWVYMSTWSFLLALHVIHTN